MVAAVVMALTPGFARADTIPINTPGTGTMAGEAGTEGGASTYSVPITVPPGRAGVQPSLSLNYSSRSGDGIMGLGWSLSGVSSIHRCPRTPEQDSVAGGVSFTANDRLCLDGQRLVPFNPGDTYGASGTQYRTEIDTLVRVTQIGALTGDTACFRVEEKSGRVSDYGATISGSNCDTATASIDGRIKPAGAAATLTWMVKKVADHVGNFEMYHYITTYGNGEVLIGSITYTGFGTAEGNRSVTFAYAPRLGTDISSSYIAGGLTLQSHQLQKITTSNGTSTVRTYTPGYGSSAHSRRLTMTSLQECAPSSPNCHPATTFDFIDGALDADVVSLTSITGLPDGSQAVDMQPNLSKISILGDLDGDGARESATEFTDTTTHRYLLQLSADRQIESAVDLSGTRFSLSPGDYADMDGDGRVELIERPSANEQSYVYLGVWKGARGVPASVVIGKAGGTPAENADDLFQDVRTNVPFSTTDGPIYARDVNGDGKLDLLVVRPDSTCDPSGHAGTCRAVFAYFNNFSGTLASQNPAANFTTTSVKLFQLIPSYNGNGYHIPRIEHISDFNGDGYPDFFIVNDGTDSSIDQFGGIWMTQPGGTSATLGTCTGIGLVQGGGSDECHWQNGYATHWMDVNGDGLEDWVFARPGGNWHVRLNTGGHLGTDNDTGKTDGLTADLIGGVYKFRYATSLPTMDVDGDGRADVLIPSVSQGFALKICTIRGVSPQETNDGDGHPHCPTTDKGNIVGSQAPDFTASCPAWSCPEEVGVTGGPDDPLMNMPSLNTAEARGFKYQWGGLPAFPARQSNDFHGTGADNSAYHLAYLKFRQTTSGFTADVIETPFVSGLRSADYFSAGDDLYGDGLPDLVSPIGCTKGVNYFTHPTAPVTTTDNCSAVNDTTHGPPTFPDEGSTPTATLATHAVLYANLNNGVGGTGRGTGTTMPPLIPDLLSDATNGVGDYASWVYAPLAQPITQDGIKLYSIGRTTDGWVDDRYYLFTSSMPVVMQMTRNNGLDDDDGFRSLEYGYTAAIYHHLGRGFQGFASIKSRTMGPDNTRNVVTTTNYEQKFPLSGKVDSIVVARASDSRTLTSETSTWLCKRSDLPGVTTRTACSTGQAPVKNVSYLPLQNTGLEERFDPGTGTKFAETRTANAATESASDTGWDRYANLVNQVVVTCDYDAANSTCTNTRKSLTNNTFTSTTVSDWWLDELTQKTTTLSFSYAASRPAPDGSTAAPARVVTQNFGWNNDHTPAYQTTQPNVANQELTTTYSYPLAPATSYGLPTSITISGNGITPARASTALTYTKDGTNAANDGYFVLTSTRTANSTAHTTTTTRSASDGQVLTQTDANGVRTSTSYDGFGRPLQIDYKDSSNNAFMPSQVFRYTPCAGTASGGCSGLNASYGEDGNQDYAAWRVTRSQAGHPTSVDWFDVLGRNVKHAEKHFDETYVVSYTNYDEMNSVAFQSTPFELNSAGDVTGWDYDVLGRPTKKIAQGSELDTHGDVVTDYTYSGGTATLKVHASTVSTCSASTNLCMNMKRTYDATGRLIETVQDNGATTNYATTDYWYDGAGNLLFIEDPETNVTRFGYDAVGHRTSVNDPDGGAWTLVYDGLGEIKSQTDERSVSTTFTYDTLGRLVQRVATNTSAVAPNPKYIQDNWGFDPAGTNGGLDLPDFAQRKTGTTLAGVAQIWNEKYRYEPTSKRPQTITSSLDGQSDWTTTLTYDSAGRELTVGYPSGLTVRKGYTSYGALSSLLNDTTGATYWRATEQDAWGNTTAETFGSTITGAHDAYETTGQLREQKWTLSTGPLDKWNYSYDSFGNVRTSTRSIEGASASVETFSYDGLQRLSQSARTIPAGNPPAITYAYTKSGNIDIKSDYSASTGGSYHYGGNNCGPHGVSQVVNSSGSPTFTCDNNGNVISGAVGGKYDFNNQPWELTRSSGSYTFEYTASGEVFHQEAGSNITWFGPRGYESSQSGAVLRHELGPVIVLRQSGDDLVLAVLRDRLGSQVMLADVGSGAAGLGSPTISITPSPSLDGHYVVSWSTVSGATEYVLQRTPNGGTEVLAYSGGLTSWSPTAADTVGIYSYRVQACNDTSCSAYSASVDEEVEPPAPTISVAPNPSTTGSYTVSWSASTGAFGYSLEELVSGTWTEIVHLSPSLSLPVAGKPSGAYSYRVHACLTQCGAYSATAIENVSTNSVPLAPEPVTGAPPQSTTGSYTISWATISNATSYRLQEQSGTGGWTDVPGVTGTSKPFANRSNGTYNYRAQACNANGCSPPTVQYAEVVNVPQPPPTPGSITISPNPSNDGNYTVTWAPVAGTGITYQLDETSATAPGIWGNVANQSTLTWSPPTPKADGSYGYRVRSCKAGVCSTYRYSITEIVRHTPPPPTSIWITPYPTSTGHFVVNWTASPGATAYYLDEQVNGGQFYTIDDYIPGTSYPRDQGNGTYGYRVRACALISGQARCSANTPVVTETVAGSGIPGEPTFIDGPSSCLSSPCTYTVTWGASANVQEYEIHMSNDMNDMQTDLVISAPATSTSITKSAIHGSQTLYFHKIRACTGTGGSRLCSPYRGTLAVAVGPANRAGMVEVSTSYDAFGKTRVGDFSDKQGGTLNLLPDTLHGFTGHEHLDDVQLLHMGGRVYDYQLGRFLSVDPVIGNPAYPQSLNPYSYILNNPLAGKDPSGYFTCDEKGNCNGTIGEIEKIDIYKDHTATATNKDGETIQLGDIRDQGVRSTVNSFAADALLGGSNGSLTVQGSSMVPSFSPDSIESNLSRASVLPAGQLPSHGDAFGGSILALGNSLSFGIGSVLFDDSARADIEAFERSYGAAAAILGVIRDLRNPVAGAKDAEEKIEKAIAKSIPNPWGRHGSPAHSEKVAQRAAELEAEGHEIVAGGGRFPERAVETPEGAKRFPDISTKGPDGKPYYENVGRSTKSGQPIARERRNLDAIGRATNTEPGYTPYDQ